MPSGLRVRRGAEPVEPQDFKYIKPETLDPKNFIICDGECQDEGFWALIGEFYSIYFIIQHFLSFWSWCRSCINFLHNRFLCVETRTNCTWNCEHNNFTWSNWWISLCRYCRHPRLGICWWVCRWCWCSHYYHQRRYMYEK